MGIKRREKKKVKEIHIQLDGDEKRKKTRKEFNSYNNEEQKCFLMVEKAFKIL